ncbi:LytR/AlgR family response regulator transcription factor [Facklamia lactis]|uniref:LytR/AlgR family response regulator transcription factor n=1 Tax=Facklamia lactis TaxID=2749967 RepID=UPI0018CF78D9|nr:LytTR family transcriptional regulator DNA-binding domain-containing protein [Facklamia lactis]MBG9979598.1 LytTR family transcriptional regulator DNA-binding domain-containing protein [Facklamia lactis]
MKYLLVDDEHLAIQELTYLIQTIDPSIQIESAQSIKEALGILLTQSIDVAFLDIQMNDESGMELAQHIQAMVHPPLIVFATAYDDYALQAFQVNAVDYLVKPFKEEDVDRIIHKLQQRLSEKVDKLRDVQGQEAMLALNTEDRIVMLEVNRIEFLTAVAGRVEVHTDQAVYQTKETLKALKDKLPDPPFIQVHRSYVINRHAIQEIQPWFNQTYQLTLQNGSKVPVSRSQMTEFKRQMGID